MASCLNQSSTSIFSISDFIPFALGLIYLTIFWLFSVQLITKSEFGISAVFERVSFRSIRKVSDAALLYIIDLASLPVPIYYHLNRMLHISKSSPPAESTHFRKYCFIRILTVALRLWLCISSTALYTRLNQRSAAP